MLQVPGQLGLGQSISALRSHLGQLARKGVVDVSVLVPLDRLDLRLASIVRLCLHLRYLTVGATDQPRTFATGREEDVIIPQVGHVGGFDFFVDRLTVLVRAGHLESLAVLGELVELLGLAVVLGAIGAGGVFACDEEGLCVGNPQVLDPGDAVLRQGCLRLGIGIGGGPDSRCRCTSSDEQSRDS
ncbi:hypothetical protein D3C86_1475750 [compost metagenome]